MNLTSIYLVTFLFSVLIFGALTEKPISLQIKNLSHWKNSPVATDIQIALVALHNSYLKYQGSSEAISSFKQYKSIFKNLFLLLDAESNGFGGFFA